MSNCQRDIIILIVNIAVFIQRKMLKKLCTVSSLTNLTHKFATHLDVFDYSGQFKKVRLTKDVMKGLGRLLLKISMYILMLYRNLYQITCCTFTNICRD